jgi:hypothetical protein
MINDVAINLDQVGTKALTTAIGVLGPRLAAAALKQRGRRADDLSIARWFESYRITAKFPSFEGISAEVTDLLSDVLRGEEAQAALQELLAVRLTDGDDVEAARVREVFHLTLSGVDPSLSEFGPLLADFYDGEISSMVARLEAAEPSMLAQIRSEAFSGRMIAILRAIERHTAALSDRPNARSEASFLASYRTHVVDEFGKLEPPDFDRRRRVPIADIYVPALIYEEVSSERILIPDHQVSPPLSVWELATRLDRTVLLGDPGGGKTTASTVLMHHFASDNTRQVPFLVTLRKYAASDPPERSVVRYIEHELETLYQCPAPVGLVDMLLLTGRSVVIFDGLDELLDTSRRADVASRVEHFCSEYPLAPVLVTSRVVGYDQARLDESQFVSHRLGGFRQEEVAEYANKWFALEEGTRADEADAFLSESESVPDLRTNPLLLSLMCILYRGEGSLPRNRAEVYEQCASLLFHRWDARRRIHQDLRAGHLIEPTLRHLAWWLFIRDNTQTAVTERELVGATTEFLHGRGFESQGDALEAAREFIQFCTGRMWVFSDAGTTSTGEKLYSFTHRTFLEYFAAAQLAYDSDTPEKLARVLAPHIARGEWEVVDELSVQIKDTTSREGARRMYELLLNNRRRSINGRSNVLQFLARTLRSVDPSPQLVRSLSRVILDFTFSGDPAKSQWYLPLTWLMESTSYCAIVDEEISGKIASLVRSSDPSEHLNGLRLAIWLENGAIHASRSAQESFRRSSLYRFWAHQGSKYRQKYRREIRKAAEQRPDIRNGAVSKNVITFEQAIAIDGNLIPLLQHQQKGIFGPSWASILRNSFWYLISVSENSKTINDITAVGRYLTLHPQPPWGSGEVEPESWALPDAALGTPVSLSLTTYLGGAAIACILAESNLVIELSTAFSINTAHLGPLHAMLPYIQRRQTPGSFIPLPDLPVSHEFKQVFRDWAEGKVNFTASTPTASDQSPRP